MRKLGLFEPVDDASTVFVRTGLGVMLAVEVVRFFAKGWIASNYIKPEMLFPYYGFQWVRPWPGIGMYVHFVALGALAALLALGRFPRVAAALLCAGWSYVFLLDQTYYLNHVYFVCLLCFLFALVPARPGAVPWWGFWLLRVQIGIPYFFGGIAKLNFDWLHGEPIRATIRQSAAVPIIGRFAGEEWLVYVIAYGGLAFDLFVVPALLWRRTRPFAFAAAVLFHVTNSQVYQIGIFPWLMIAATTIFFEPDWPRRLLHLPRSFRPEPAPSLRRRRATIAFLSVYLAIQAFLPFRHLLYPGDSNWTEEGQSFAWRMKLREKSGDAIFQVVERGTGRTLKVDPRGGLTRQQYGHLTGMPDMILQYAHALAAEMRRRGWGPVEVRAQTRCSMNGRRPQPLVDPDVNLVAEELSLRPARWIVPLREPLRPRAAPGPRKGQ